MAFSYGFFNSKGLDRTYTAENFCDYLGSIICNGIQDTYGQNFSLRPATGLSVTLGTGKAWINGHYFISDAPYSIDLSGYQNESLPRYVAISIVLDMADSARKVYIEVTPGTPAENPTLPVFSNDTTKTRLVMYAVRMNAGASSITANDWYDYRGNEDKCGYCRCILGKCKVTEMLLQLELIKRFIQENNEKIEELTGKVDNLKIKVDDLTGDIVSTGEIGENAYYVLYSNGNLLIRGTGATFDYEIGSSPFWENAEIKNLVVSNGITRLGDSLFERCVNMANVTFPDTLKEIGTRTFFMYSNGGFSSVTIPDSVTSIGEKAFVNVVLESVTLPHNLTTFGSNIFMDCDTLLRARFECETVPSFCFVRCVNLRELFLSRSVKTLGSHMINYCENLSEIIYEGTLDEWAEIRKQTNWDGNKASLYDGYLNTVRCTDGHMEFNRETREWTEVRE